MIDSAPRLGIDTQDERQERYEQCLRAYRRHGFTVRVQEALLNWQFHADALVDFDTDTETDYREYTR